MGKSRRSGRCPRARGVFFLNVNVQNGCTILGAHLSTSPASGKIVYAEADQLPNASYASIQPNAPGGFVVGASGTITLNITEVATPCAQAPWPVDMGAYTVLGPITVQAGAFHDTSIFVRNPG